MLVISMVQFLLVVRVADAASAVSGILAARGTERKAYDSISTNRSPFSRCCAVQEMDTFLFFNKR